MIVRRQRTFFLRTILLISIICTLPACSVKRDPSLQGPDGAAVNDSVTTERTDSSDTVATEPNADDMEECDLGEASNAGENKESQETLDEALEFCRISQDFWGKGDFETAIDSLDQAYALILQADTSENPKFIQQKEDIRFMICKRMLEIYASQSTVVNGSHNAIPMVMNRYVEKEIDSFQGRERDFFIESYKRSGHHRDYIIKSLKAAGLPEELSWLPLIESGFKVKALSSARALGLWQFIPSTGYKFGLQRSQWIDERMDVEKATQGAISYMKELHELFGDWSTVLAAYNCGEFRVLRVIQSQNINYLDNFWDLFEKLPYETARYVPRFMATLHIINDPQKYGFDLSELASPVMYEKVTVNKQMSIEDIANKLEVDKEEMEMLNAELRYQVTLPTEYDLKVPLGKGKILTAKLDEIADYVPPRAVYDYHRVRSGETLSSIARRYDTNVNTIMQTNNLRKQTIRVGQQLKIPARGTRTAALTAPAAVHKDTSKSLHHRVTRGDSLWVLARMYNTTVQEIMRLNQLGSPRLYTGQSLVIRQGTQKVDLASEDTKKYCVKQGDSPYQIATAHNMELERFLSLNHLTPRSRIYPGQTLLVEAEK